MVSLLQRGAAALILAASVVLTGCDGRVEDAGGVCLAACDPPRVPDCIRRAPEATPLARIAHGGSWSSKFDGDGILFVSDGLVMRLPTASGAAVPLTPPNVATGASKPVRIPGGLAWRTQTAFQTFDTATGETRTLLTSDDGLDATLVVGDGVVSAPWRAEPTTISWTPFDGGAPRTLAVLPPESPNLGLYGISDGGDGHVLTGRQQELFDVALDGSGVRDLGRFQSNVVVADGDTIYGNGIGLASLPRAGGVEDVLGALTTLDLAVDEDDVFALGFEESDTVGKLLRISRATGEVTPMADVDIDPIGPPIAGGYRPSVSKTFGVAVDDAFVYFEQACGDDDPGAYRIVRLPKDASL